MNARGLYVVPSNLVPPPGAAEWHAQPCPGGPAHSLLYVEWVDDVAQDALEDTVGVLSLHQMLDLLIPAALVPLLAVAPWNVLATDTVRQALRKIRTTWSPVRRVGV